jgi:hypothetical protein
MGTADGYIVGLTKVLDHGLASDRFNIVMVAEGYQASELGQFATDVDRFITTLQSYEPFPTYIHALNIYRLDVASDDSGADDPAACGGPGTLVDTYFDAHYCNGGIRRLLQVNSGLVINTVDTYLPEWGQIIVIVNHNVWGGSGGSIATTCNSGSWDLCALHEMGHAAFGLADEYEYWAGCGSDVGHDHYGGGEPANVNITIDTNRATIKWGDLIDASTPLPTTVNADCSHCDPQASPEPAGTVGAFEGAYYYHCGVYRPEFNCMMRNLAAFCAVCQRRIKAVLDPYMPLIPHIPDWYHELFEWQHIILPRWILVAYLQVNWAMKDLVKGMKVKPGKAFLNTVTKYLSDYMTKNVMPPADVAPAILNMADDFMAGRPMNLRAGDYIAIQKHMKKNKIM